MKKRAPSVPTTASYCHCGQMTDHSTQYTWTEPTVTLKHHPSHYWLPVELRRLQLAVGGYPDAALSDPNSRTADGISETATEGQDSITETATGN